MASASRTAPRLDIISIGTLSRNRLWAESDARRTAHATTALIRTTDRAILIDPGLPPPALAARLFERTGLSPDRVDTVFLTNFRPAHRAGLSLFTKAKVLMHQLEIEFARADLDRLLEEAPEQDEDAKLMRQELKLLDAVQSPEDRLVDGVDLFPLFGYTPGTCGLLVASPTTTTLISGDAVPTYDHFLAGQVLPDAKDIAAAQESMREVYEIADLIVPGHDNLFLNPRSQGM
ncbi:MAG TPA: MBL fold metallo-hydrolase [Tepidisphaeraceae bacterium]|nr:MBL fold metallo-hydrolase [Tepidisphaeraceae bacterium]